MLLEEISKHGPNLCFLDFVTSPEQAFDLLAALSEKKSYPAVIALLTHDNPELVLRCLRRGVSGVLLSPFSPEQLEIVLRRVADLFPKIPGAPAKRARTFAIVPVKGSCGATTVASNLAAHVKSAGAESVLLADMDPVASTLSFQLKMHSQYSFVDALRHPGELDRELWKALVTNCRGIDVLPSPDNSADGTVRDQDPGEIVEFARNQYQFVFLDLASAYGSWNTALAQLSDEVLAVLSCEMPAVYSAQRMLVHLERQGVARAKLRMIVNRHRRGPGLEPQDIETALGMNVFAVLPNDPDSIGKAMMEARPVASNTQLGKAIVRLMNQLECSSRRIHKPQSRGGFFSLFSR